MCTFSQSTSLCMVADSHIPSCYWDREPTKSRSSGIFCFPTFFKCLSKYPHYSRMGFSLLMVSSPKWFLLLQSFIWLPMSTRCYCFWRCFYHVKYCSIFPLCVYCSCSITYRQWSSQLFSCDLVAAQKTCVVCRQPHHVWHLWFSYTCSWGDMPAPPCCIFLHRLKCSESSNLDKSLNLSLFPLLSSSFFSTHDE